MPETKCTDDQLALITEARTAPDIRSIARVVYADWTNVYFGAVPYLAAMEMFISPFDRNELYGVETARTVVLYFLSNAKTWRGPVAQVVKQILKEKMGVK